MLQDIKPVHTGHVYIQADQIVIGAFKVALVKAAESLFTIGGDIADKVLLKYHLQDKTGGNIIIHDQTSSVHSGHLLRLP